MSSSHNMDLPRAHRHFAAACFNRTWDYLRKTDRTPEDDEQMVLLSTASLWHWTQRDDCTDRNRGIGHWQLSRVYAVLGDAAAARRHGERCLEYSRTDAPFYLGYAHEALARAALVAGDAASFHEHLASAQRLLAAVTDREERELLEPDLKELAAREPG
jgi:hypothetical protein